MSFVFYCILGCFLGLVVGALPGISVTMATAVLVGITYTWNTYDAIAMIMGVYVVGVFSGAVSAVLVNIPGAPGSVATVLDGYPLAKKGRASTALYTATIYSFIGTLIGLGALWLFAKPISSIAVLFSALDYFLIGVLGMLCSAAISGKNYVKGIISAAFGLILSCVGIDGIYGVQRFTFGADFLKSGIPTVAALIGLFGMSEVLSGIRTAQNKGEILKVEDEKVDIKGILSHFKLGVISSVIGTVIGALPGAGSPVAALMAYMNAKNIVKNPTQEFGKGAVEGIVASESSNNACIGGALIPMLTLGVPGDAVTAVILSVLIIHGMTPGPFFISENPQLFYAVLAGGFISAFGVLIMGLILNKPLSKLLNIDRGILLPCVALLCVVGAYSVKNVYSDIFIMLFFGVLGYFMKKFDYPSAPLILGLVLGQMCDLNLRRTVTIFSAQGGFYGMVLSRPVTIVLFVLIILSIGYMLKPQKK